MAEAPAHDVYKVLLELQGDIGEMKGDLGFLKGHVESIQGQFTTLQQSVDKIDDRLQSVEKQTRWHSGIVSFFTAVAVVIIASFARQWFAT